MPSLPRAPPQVRLANRQQTLGDRILTPEGQIREGFFLTDSHVSADFPTNHPAQDEFELRE